MSRIGFFILFIFSAAVIHAQSAGYKVVSDESKFRSEYLKTAQGIKAIRSDFIQEKNLSMLSEKIVSEGKFWFKKDNMVRMEYLKPYKYLLIINKTQVIIKDGEKTNAMSAKSNKLFQQISRITVDCVQGTVFDNPDFNIKVFEGDSKYLIEMTPVSKNLKEYFSTINIEVGKKDYDVHSINMKEPAGDYTLITFRNKDINPDIPDSVFTLKE